MGMMPLTWKSPLKKRQRQGKQRLRIDMRQQRQTTTILPAMMALLFIQLLFMSQHQKSYHVFGQLTDPSTVQVGDTVCFEGYVMDYFCIDRGTLLDNSDVITLEGPNEHSIHCLIEVPACNTSPFEILGDPIVGNTTADSDQSLLYTRAYRVDDNGRSMLIDLARSHGSCSTCSGSSESESTPILNKGFRAEVYGSVMALSNSSDEPVQLQVTDVKRSNDQAIVCGMARMTPAPAPVSSESGESGIGKESSKGGAGITVLSVIVVLMAVSLTIMSLYFGLIGTSSSAK